MTEEMTVNVDPASPITHYDFYFSLSVCVEHISEKQRVALVKMAQLIEDAFGEDQIAVERGLGG